MIKKLKKMMIQAAYNATETHIGSALSIAEIIYAIYFRLLDINKENCKSLNRDRVIISKSHAALAQYAALTLKGIIPMEIFDTYAKNGGKLPAYLDKNVVDCAEVSTGMSLGHGLGIAQGIVLANRLKNIKSQIFVVIGDGELQEGSVWEALNSVAFMKLSEITVILDKNGMQSSAPTSEIADYSNIDKVFQAMGYDTAIVNGHDVEDVVRGCKTPHKKPLIVIANTIKGHGIPGFENTVKSHYIKMDEECYKKAIELVEKSEK